MSTRATTGDVFAALFAAHQAGPVKYRVALRWWECPGFDGEGCAVQLVCDEDLARGVATAFPGVTVQP